MMEQIAKASAKYVFMPLVFDLPGYMIISRCFLANTTLKIFQTATKINLINKFVENLNLFLNSKSIFT